MTPSRLTAYEASERGAGLAPATGGESAQPNTLSAPAARGLDDVVARLHRRFGHTGAGQSSKITAWVQEAAAEFIDAPVQTYVPILVERIVRRRIETTR